MNVQLDQKLFSFFLEMVFVCLQMQVCDFICVYCNAQ